jgi:hypothetical protein
LCSKCLTEVLLEVFVIHYVYELKIKIISGYPVVLSSVIPLPAINSDSWWCLVVYKVCSLFSYFVLIDRGVLYTCGEGRHGKLCSDQDNNSHAIPIKVTKFKGFTVQKVRICAWNYRLCQKPDDWFYTLRDCTELLAFIWL